MAEKPASPEPSGFEPAKMYLWIKALEGKVNNLLKEVSLLKNDALKKSDQLRRELKTLNEDLVETRREQEDTLQKMDLIIKELQRTAGKEEVAVLKKYLEYWNPLTFVTQRDVERVVESQLEQPPAEKNI